MQFHRFYYAPLAQASFLIADEGEAAIIDPRRDVDEVLAFAAERDLNIRWVLATHVHADFVAGLAEIAAATGARVGMGDRFPGSLRCHRLADDDTLTIGGARLRVLATPGHTTDSVCYVIDRPTDSATQQRVLSGDTLFLGDVGRPDLAASADATPRDMARMLFRSLHERLLPLPPETEVWPTHGAGSACGANLSSEASSTIALQRQTNWALAEHDIERFCDRLLLAQRPAPAYFARAVVQNLAGPRLLRDLAPPKPLVAAAVASAITDGAIVLDVRSPAAFARGHWPQALSVDSEVMTFEMWAGALLEPGQPIVLHAASQALAHAAWHRLLGIGLEDTLGFTTDAPPQPVRHELLEAVELFLSMHNTPHQVVDVREQGEYATGHIAGAVHIELGPNLAESPRLTTLDRAQPTAVVCLNGVRSSAALRQLAEAGFTNLKNVSDGMSGWRGNHLPLVRGSSPLATA